MNLWLVESADRKNSMFIVTSKEGKAIAAPSLRYDWAGEKATQIDIGDPMWSEFAVSGDLSDASGSLSGEGEDYLDTEPVDDEFVEEGDDE
jgi:hypothetical protein